MKLRWSVVSLLAMYFLGHWFLSKWILVQLEGNSPSTQTLKDVIGLSTFQPVNSRSGQCTYAHKVWQETYVPLHDAILTGKLPPRFLIHVPIHKGVADQLSGLITMFYFAYFTDRAFQLASIPETFPPFSVAFDMPNINWSSAYPREQSRRTWNMVDSDRRANQLANSDFSTLANNTLSHLFVNSNRGRTYQIGSNPFYKAKLKELRLTPTLLAPCAFEFLFTPNPAVQKLQERFLKTINDPDALRIGIAVRTGDKVMWSQKELDWDRYVGWLKCAEAVEKAKMRSGKYKRAIWYLITDSQEFRKRARELIGDKLVTDLETKPAHTTCDGRGSCGDQNAAFQFAMSELLLFTHTQYQVVSKNSGFGRWGAWLSKELQVPHIYEYERTKNCINPDHPANIANQWAGI